MDVAYISALSALAGSLVGGLTFGTTTWMGLHWQLRSGRRNAELIRRQDLYKEFIVTASRIYGHAIMSSEPQIEELVALYALLSRMKVSCSQRICACADRINRLIIDTYFGPNKTLGELHEMIKSGIGIDPLKEFSEIAREELEPFEKI